MQETAIRLLSIEKCETRQMSAVDLTISMEVDVLSSESLQIGRSCTAAPYSALPVYEIAERESVILDVDQDGFVTPSDLDLIVQQLLKRPKDIGPTLPEVEHPVVYNLDVNQDGVVSPTDALIVVTRLNFYNELVPCNCANCLANAIVDGDSFE